MKIDMTKEEYRVLLDIVHIADVIVSGHRRDEDKRTVTHRELIQKLYLLAHDEGQEKLIGFNKSARKYVPTPEFEENSLSHTLIDEFGDHLFWDQLIARLAVRDAAHRAGGIEHLNAMSEHDRQSLEGAIRQRYVEEFSTHGVANLNVIERFSPVEGIPVKTSD